MFSGARSALSRKVRQKGKVFEEVLAAISLPRIHSKYCYRLHIVRNTTLLFLSLTFLPLTLTGQIIHLQTFPSAAFPTGWSTNSSRVTPNDASPSSGYNPPPASGGYNMRMSDCEPVGDTITLTVNGVISTVGYTGIRVGFGVWRSSDFNRPVSFRWSANGTTWNTISGNITDSASTTWKLIYFDLPAAAQNVPNLRFRFSYVAQTNMSCTASPPVFRIDDFAVGENFSLPVELMRFDARAEGEGIRLTWATASEHNSAYFDIERSGPDARFEPIGRVAAAGYSLQERQYEFFDARPLPGTNYYRLRQADADGTFSYSPIRQVQTTSTATILSVFPSPATSVLHVSAPAPTADVEARWQIFDLMGRLWRQGTAADSSGWSIPVHDLPAGTYLLQCAIGGKTLTQRFQKQ